MANSSTSRRRFVFSAIAASSVAIPATVAVAAAKPDEPPEDEMELLAQYRRLSPGRQEELIGWAKWQADLGR